MTTMLETNTTNNDQEVARDLLAALQDDELTDVYLVGGDSVQVPTCRFVLAARSKVLKRMLYGSFREAKSSTICMMGYNSDILQAVVDYCYRNDISKFRSSISHNEEGVRNLVDLSKAADYLELKGLQQQADRVLRELMCQHPALTCAVFDDAGIESELSDYALQMMECRPYVALVADDETIGGGIECLGSERLLEVLKNPLVEAGELFLFQRLRHWFEHQSANGNGDAALKVAHECCRSLRFENIEPKELLSQVQVCHFVSPERIFDAVAKQALRASQQRVWSLPCRGRESVERVLVQGAGNFDVNGMYYHITGLANGGDIYSKREVACGQQYVYTLSCSVKDDMYECRIFGSKLLTHRAVSSLETMQRKSVIDPVFQPVMQVVQVRTPSSDVPVPIRKYFHVRLSDGEVCMPGTLATALAPLVESNEVVENSVIKILEFGLYELGEGCTAIHISKLSIVSRDPGQHFGNPANLSGEGVVNEQVLSDDDNDDSSGGLQSLYSCHYPVDHEAKDTKIPRSGWTVEDHGISPSPTCTWVAAVPKPKPNINKRDSAISVCSEQVSKSPSNTTV